jgi:RNA 2',3'-cyclic 3'-phosphodiesterase
VTDATAARLRLFVAVSVPRPQREALDAAVAGLRDDLPGARWTPLDNQHVTLKFLGSTPAELFADVAAAVTSSAESHAPSEIALAGLGAFPSNRRARVLWAGIDDPESLLRSLAASLDRAMEPLGYSIEKRPFTPHLTLARFKQPARVTGILRELDPDWASPWTVEAVELYQSRLSPKGATYEVLGTVPLNR